MFSRWRRWTDFKHYLTNGKPDLLFILIDKWSQNFVPLYTKTVQS